MLNPIDNNQRGIGRSFQFSGGIGSKTFFERDVSMNDFDRLFGGQELTDEQLRDLKMDPYSKSYLLCKGCEDRMRIVENYFKDNVFDKITPEDKEFVNSALNSNNLLIRLFFLSMSWRASVAEFDSFKLPNEIEERLREIIHDSIGNDLDETTNLANDNSEFILNEAIFCCTTRYFCDITANQITIIDQDTPYYFEINEYSLCYFPDQKNLKVQQNLFGLEKYISDLTINLHEDQFKICLVKSSDWNLKRNGLFRYAASKFTQSLRETFVDSYKKTYAKEPDLKLVQAFMTELIHGSGTTTALRYTDERINGLMEKYKKNNA